MFIDLYSGLSAVLTDPNALFWCLIGVIIGTIVGTLPGIGPVTGLAVLLPLTFQLETVSALVLLISVYLGSMYGGRISSILINIPGDEGAVVTTFDGYPLTRQGKAGYALTISAIASFIGGLIGLLGLVLLINIISDFALLFGPVEYFSLIVFTLIVATGIGQTNPIKSAMSLLLGLFFSTIGLDGVSGAERLTFGIYSLWDGLDIVVVAIGVYGLSEVLMLIREKQDKKIMKAKIPLSNLMIKVKDLLINTGSIIRGSIIGFIIGVLPGSGTVLATFLTYSLEKRISKEPSKFGHGAPQGLSGPEAANNSSVGGALIPTFTLGIPGSGTAAILLGGLMIIGLQPGPLLIVNSGDIMWATFAALFIANILLLFLNTIFIPSFAALIQKAQPYLVSIIVTFSFIGVYSIRSSLFDVGLAIGFGLLGYLMRRTGFSVTPLFLGVILGPMLELNLRTGLQISNGNFLFFFTEPISLFFMIMSILVIVLTFTKKNKTKDNI